MTIGSLLRGRYRGVVMKAVLLHGSEDRMSQCWQLAGAIDLVDLACVTVTLGDVSAALVVLAVARDQILPQVAAALS